MLSWRAAHRQCLGTWQVPAKLGVNLSLAWLSAERAAAQFEWLQRVGSRACDGLASLLLLVWPRLGLPWLHDGGATSVHAHSPETTRCSWSALSRRLPPDRASRRCWMQSICARVADPCFDLQTSQRGPKR